MLTKTQSTFVVGAIVVLVGLYLLAVVVKWAAIAAVIAVLVLAVFWWLKPASSGTSDRSPYE